MGRTDCSKSNSFWFSLCPSSLHNDTLVLSPGSYSVCLHSPSLLTLLVMIPVHFYIGKTQDVGFMKFTVSLLDDKKSLLPWPSRFCPPLLWTVLFMVGYIMSPGLQILLSISYLTELKNDYLQ